MRKTHEPQAALKALIAAIGVSTMVMASAPAHAGPFGILKKAAEKELKKAAEERLAAEAEKHGVVGLIQAGTTVATASEIQAQAGEPLAASGTQRTRGETTLGDVLAMAATSATDDGHKDWIIIESMSSPLIKMSQNGTTVATASEVTAGQAPSATQIGKGRARARAQIDAAFQGGVRVATGDINGDGTADIIVGPGLCALVQNGTTVATADEVLSMSMEGSRWSRILDRAEIEGACELAGLSQNGTTVATANEILAPDSEVLVGLLLPAVQSAREAARPARAGMSQNGTTVETADTILGPNGDPIPLQAAYLKIGDIKGEAKLGQSGHTTVPSADTVRAPEGTERASPYLKIEGVKGESKD